MSHRIGGLKLAKKSVTYYMNGPLCTDFQDLYLKFVFVFFWRKKIGEKAVHTMLVKITIARN